MKKKCKKEIRFSLGRSKGKEVIEFDLTSVVANILKYKEKSKEKSRKVREALTQEAQDLDLGY